MPSKKPSRLLNSRAYRKAKSVVTATLQSPAQLLALVSDAGALRALTNNDRFASILEPTKTAFRLVKSYARGEYRSISRESLALIVTSIIYFVMPIDLIPDFIVSLGFIDDVSLLAWTLSSVSQDLDRFSEWESNQPASEDPDLKPSTTHLLEPLPRD
ncbi:YkvA family protein [Arenicella xantha]|uniref:Uncharacterized membrane protein YkvA (DUF1232 family) n=1 Tax=Arenicella xantha TaxID=644221 RepID=A0A395JSM1_9GAMM|nr:DUF1232 domain-containing protein [Arenicella xantha]RBP53466.1 uncharacterized membrane protein YkvA (DUF1232 family) [Arenicella xantha]